MRSKKFISFISVLSLFCISGCDKASTANVNPKSGLPILSEQNVSRNGCLNLEALGSVLSVNTPALEVVTDFVTDTKLNEKKVLFQAYSAFDLKELTTSKIFLLRLPEQKDCTSIRSITASGEHLKYKITKSSLDSISFQLDKTEASDLPIYREENLETKLQPFKFKIQIITNTHFRVATTYRSFDAHCRSNAQPISTIFKDYYWSQFGEPLPAEIKISEKFYNQYLSTLVPAVAPSEPDNRDLPITIPEPVPLSDETSNFISVSISTIKELRARSLREEYVKCTNL